MGNVARARSLSRGTIGGPSLLVARASARDSSPPDESRAEADTAHIAACPRNRPDRDGEDERHGLRPMAWLLWAGACTLATATTRNPLYLALVLLCAGAAYRAARADGDAHDAGARATRWNGPLRLAASLALVSVLFNALTVHAGDMVLARIPPDIPLVGAVIGGPVTANALAYGLLAALATATILLVFAAANAAVGFEELLRLLPAPLAGFGVTLAVAFGFLPGTFAALREVREAQAVRGLPPPRGMRDLPPLLLPVLALGLERALSLAEAMAARGYGMPATDDGTRPPRRTSYRATPWGVFDTATAAGAIIAAVALVALWFGGDALVYYPYPSLASPPFAPAVAAALAPLLLPALLAPFAVARVAPAAGGE